MKKLYEESSIQQIADAIRSKTGTSETMKVSEMPAKINGLSKSVYYGEKYYCNWNDIKNVTPSDKEVILVVNFIEVADFTLSFCDSDGRTVVMDGSVTKSTSDPAATDLRSITFNNVSKGLHTFAIKTYISSIIDACNLRGQYDKFNSLAVIIPNYTLNNNYDYYNHDLYFLKSSGTNPTIAVSMFRTYYKMLAIMNNNNVVALGSRITQDLSRFPHVFVPDNLYNNYLTATNWVTITNKIHKLSELEFLRGYSS